MLNGVFIVFDRKCVLNIVDKFPFYVVCITLIAFSYYVENV